MDSRPLNATPSQDTLISLLDLDPTPIQDAEKDPAPLPEASSRTDSTGSVGPGSAHVRTSSLGLSGSGYGSIYYFTRIQRYSTYALSVFTGLHLANTSIVPLITRSVASSESYMLLAREIYQTPLGERLFVALPVLVHVASGVALRLVRRSQNLKRYGGATPALMPFKSSTTAPSALPAEKPRTAWPHMSWISLSGYGFSLYLAAHVFINRLLPLHVEGDSSNIGLAYVSHGFARHPFTAYAAYAGLLGLGCGHMVWGWARWLGLAQLAGWVQDTKTAGTARHRDEDARRKRRTRRIRIWLNGMTIITAALWAAGGLGVVARGGRMHGWVGQIYDELYDIVGQ